MIAKSRKGKTRDLLVKAWQSAVMTILLLTGSSVAIADSPRELAQRYGCMACHNGKVNLVGPSFSAIAARYRTQPDAREKLMRTLRQGGSGDWGAAEQPPYADVITDQSHYKILVDWVLTY